MWKNLANRLNIKLIIIECKVDEKIHKRRIKSRIRNLYGLPEVTWQDIEKIKKEYLPWQEDHLVLDTSINCETNLNYI